VQNEHNQITGLDLDKCGLEELPPEIVNLQNLTELSLEENQLIQFPKALLDLNLEVKWDANYWEEGIYVKDNPFQTPPVEIVKQGRQAIIDYYAALEEQQKCPLNESKLRLIGDGPSSMPQNSQTTENYTVTI
jgi:Leucine-rich repeat (LRR) protein